MCFEQNNLLEVRLNPRLYNLPWLDLAALRSFSMSVVLSDCFSRVISKRPFADRCKKSRSGTSFEKGILLSLTTQLPFLSFKTTPTCEVQLFVLSATLRNR